MQAAITELMVMTAQKDALLAELSTTKGKLSKVSDSLQTSRSEFEKESQKGKAAVLDLEKLVKN